MDTFPIFDLHLDSILQNRLFGYNINRRHRALLRGQPLFWHADLPRMRDAGYRGACMGIHYWPFERDHGWYEAKRQLDVLDSLIRENDNVARASQEIAWSDVPGYDGIALTAGLEGAHIINGELNHIAEAAERGVSYLTLTHFSKNQAATPSMGRGADDESGLTAFGRELVRECEQHRIAIDLAHVNRPGVLDACRYADKPVLCTHTGVCGVTPHARNITDDEIDAIAATGGLIGIIVGPVFLAGHLRASSEIIVDHIEHVIDRVGIEHVAIGTDFDGWLPSIPNDMRDCRDIRKVGHTLRERGFNDQQLEAIGWRNTVRFFQRLHGH
jgi:membrane dipeptidase